MCFNIYLPILFDILFIEQTGISMHNYITLIDFHNQSAGFFGISIYIL